MFLFIALTTSNILGIVALLIGLALRYWINRRKFNRTVGYHLEGFRNYEHKTATRFIERLLMKIAWAAILIGLFLIIIEWFNHSHH